MMFPWMTYMGSLGNGEFDFAGEMSALTQTRDNAYNPIQGEVLHRQTEQEAL